MLAGIVLLDCMGAVAKHLVQRYPAQQISVARNVVGLLPIVAILLWEGRGRIILGSIRLRQWRLGIARGLLVAVAQLALYGSYQRLELATVAVIAYSGPLFITMLSIPWLGERVGIWRWAAVVGGFVGVVLVVGPGTDLFTWYGILPAIAAFFYANSLVLTRRFDTSVSHAAINLYAQAGAIAGSFILLLSTADAVMPSGSAAEIFVDLGLALLLGGFGGFGVYFLTLAYRRTAASLLAPFEYFGVLSALVIGWIVFSEWPVERIFPGVVFIVGAGLVIVLREHRASGRPV
ncbi:MAG: DMT family transporter [Proteobacteria bacterium]|nr:DMT family transporter [Pseudomonadota bacterium]